MNSLFGAREPLRSTTSSLIRGCVFSILLLLCLDAPPVVRAAESVLTGLPPVSCGKGWKKDGPLLTYDKENISDRINGEAELYFPYGFDRMTAARYSSEKNPAEGLDVEVYRMGSLLDAFGMFANYRQKEGRTVSAGTESNLSGSQLFMYQGRFFIRIQLTGSGSESPESLSACAREVASLLPEDGGRPPEAAQFNLPGVIRGSERYLPLSLLGYDFFNRGIMAEAIWNGDTILLFRLLGTTPESASALLAKYSSQLSQPRVKDLSKDVSLLEGNDPLYGRVAVLRSGGCFAGALKFRVTGELPALLGRICGSGKRPD